MKQHPFRRFRLHAIVLPTIVALVLVGANIVPRVQVGLPAYLDPSSRNLPPCNGVSHYGWPNSARVDEFVQSSNIASTPHYSLGHLIGTEEFGIQRTQTSMFNYGTNFGFALAFVLLLSLILRALSDRKINTKAMLAVVGLVAVMFAFFSCSSSLTTSERLVRSLQWGTAEN